LRKIGWWQINWGRMNASFHHLLEHGCPVLRSVSIFASRPMKKVAIVEMESKESARIEYWAILWEMRGVSWQCSELSQRLQWRHDGFIAELMILIPFSASLCSQKLVLRIQENPGKMQSCVWGWFFVHSRYTNRWKTKAPAMPPVGGQWSIEQ
jgi:hypothetical protein